MTSVGNLIQVLLQNFGDLEISKRAVAFGVISEHYHVSIE
jgi:hypothetical protein